ncbi:MAG: hybrid sensor histidine kinase/response regulator [Thermoanaerobaculia bacterium]
MSNPAEQEPVVEGEPVGILIVDDEPGGLTTLHAVLAPLGCRIVKAASGEQALRVLLTEDFAVILLDVQMGGMDGFETATVIHTRERSMYTPIIFLAGSEMAPGQMFRGYAVGCVDYIFKPYDPDILRSKVRVFVELARVNKAAEKHLAQMEGRYRGLLEAAPDAMVVVNQSGEIVLLNVQAENQFGYRRDELVGQKVTNIIPEGFAERLIADGTRTAAEALAQQIGMGIELIGQRKDGSEFPIEIMLSPLESAEGILVTAAIRDISVRKAAETHLAQMEGRYRGLLEAAPDAMVVVNQSGEIVLLNVQAENQFGYRRDELVGQKVTNIIPEGFAERLIADGTRCAAEALAQQIGMGIELIGQRKDGSEFPIEIMLSPLESAEGILVTAAIRDVSERLRSQGEHRRMEYRLEQAQRINSLGRVAATIAHEINNVLMGIQPFAEIIRRRAGDDERISNAAEQISNSVHRGKRVTEEILRFTNAVAPVRQIINMGEWLMLIAPELRAIVGSDVKMTVDLPPESVFAPCDSAQMQQVITNLVINARDAMPGGGLITLTLKASSDSDSGFKELPEGVRFVRLIVRDEGSGIAPEMLEQIFDPFVTTKRSGTGLGLAVARQVLIQHGGFIYAENAPGGGTAFHIFLPRADEVLSTAVAVAAQKTSGRIRRLLLVEDEVSVAAGLSSLLELEKIVVRVVEQGREVVRAIEEFAPDAVVLDLTLPDMDGREVFAQVTARWPDLPVVFSSGHGGEADLARELSRGHVRFLQKPYEVAALMAAIERAL